MRATRSASKKQSHHFVQQQTGINKLPAEILSEIFMFCDRIWSPDIKEGEFPLQARIPTICRRWRKVALDTPALWSRITFSELSEYSRAALFLSRSGSTIPLDIKISMTGPRWDETGPWKELKQQAKEALKFIVSHGGVASRWRRLWIQTNIYHVYLAAMDFLRKSQMTSLEHLEMIFSSPSGGQGVDHDLYYGIIKAPPRLLFNKCDLPLQLRTVKLAAIPTPYLFGHTSHPQLVNLTHLELQFIGFRPSLEDMRKMLAASGSTLVVLCLSSGEIKESYPEPPSEASNGELARTPLPKLQALSFTNIQYPKWELGVLKLLDAPDLKVLRIRDSGYYFGSNEYHSQMMDLLANGPDKKHPKAYFPTVTHLSYERSGTADKEKEKDLRTLLSGCPGINSLSLPSASRLTVLLEKPLLAPELVRLRVRADVMVLKKVASARHRAGIPLKVVELHGPYSFKDPTLPSRDLKLLEKYIETITMSEALKRQRQEDYNGQQCVNKLPSEILSQIFVLCNHAWDPDVEEEEFPFQVRIPTVCRQWRKVALDTPALWSRITLSEPADYARVALFMSRSGATAPLDIDIDMTELFWSNSEEATLEEFIQLAEKAFKFIVSHGGVAPRWQRFCFQTDLYHAQSIAMNFLRSSFMPSLQHLEILSSGPAELDEEDEDAYYDAVASHPKPLLHSALPRLHTVKLGRVPGPYLFGHPSHPQLVGLTRLELEFAETQPDLRDLHCMLVASSTTLAVLCLDSGSTNEVYSGSRFGAEDNRLKIHFPRLEALSLIYIACPEWELNVLQLLDAPNLTALRIKALYPQDRDEHYLQLLDLLAHVPSKNSRLYFPALTHLSCDVTSEPTEDLRVLLTAYPRISSLSLPGALRLTALLKKPLLAPDLSRLRVQAEVVPELRKLALARYKAGIPLKEVEIDHRLVQRDADYLKKYVSKVITNFIHEERLCVDPMSW